ncbi:transmembrane protein 68-like isoform X1 [Sphaerodactylus townsendi]|uniref:transmembrane protein 68-like isoform X1 n=1 Tax=Sphaerodactylus townsendi TaxID=933632 RepID=UPI002026F897|nr:transmembrane protein 68-like isoform X1 [Sphaerodactylus townsendi]
MADAAVSSASEEGTLALFTHMLKNWIGFDYLEEYLSYKWLLLAVILLYAIYPIIFFTAFIISLLLNIWKKKNNLPEDTFDKSWDLPKQVAAHFVEAVGRILHGYEVIGMENLPEGPGIIIYYHGAIVVDYLLLVAQIYIQTGKSTCSVVHHLTAQMPGIQLLLKMIGCKNANRDECVQILKEGHLLGIAPGGIRESNFSDEYYSLMWGNRVGFAKVALEAKVPIIPIFTENLRESYRTLGKIWLTKWVCDHIGVVILPIYGGFPVKLRTHIGEPITYDPNITATELAQKVNKSCNRKSSGQIPRKTRKYSKSSTGAF